MTKEQLYLDLLKKAYISYLRFNKTIHSVKSNQGDINNAYILLDSAMCEIFSEIGDEFTNKNK